MLKERTSASDPEFNDSGMLRHALIASSRAPDWTGVGIEYYRHPPHELTMPSLPDHMVCLYLGNPVSVFERQDGPTRHRVVARGEIMLAPPDCPGAEVFWDGTAEFLHMRIEPAVVREVADAAELSHAKKPAAAEEILLRDARIERTCLMILEEVVSGGPGGRLMADSLANILVVQVLRAYAETTQPRRPRRGRLSPGRLRRVIEFIRSNLGKNISTADIAKVAGLSPYHFSHLFRQTIGSPPHRYLIRCRIEEAERLLVSEDISIAEAANRVGFSDQSHFTRHFKRLRGITPREFLGDDKNVPNFGKNLQENPPRGQ